MPFIVKGEGSSVQTRWRTEIEHPPRQAKPATPSQTKVWEGLKALNLSTVGGEGNGEQKAQSISKGVQSASEGQKL